MHIRFESVEKDYFVFLPLGVILWSEFLQKMECFSILFDFEK